jgi:aflatoxin B1 aldehyde reductase
VLKLEKIPVLFLHSPDLSVPISETMDALQELYLQGKFEKVRI